MIVKARGASETQRSNLTLKENIVPKLNEYDKDVIISTLRKHQQLLIEVQKQLRHKVNKSDFAAGLSSKLSLSDITNLTMDLSNDQSKLNQSNTINLHSLQDQINLKSKENASRLEKIKKQIEANHRAIKEEYTNQYKELERKVQHLQKNVQAGNRGLLELLQKKGERSQFDKVMHLANLLAIQFELIKKRFGTFESDYSIVWKQISNIYQIQEGFKASLEAERYERQNNAKTCMNITKPNSLLNTLNFSAETSPYGKTELVLEEQVPKIIKLIDNLQKNQEDHSYSLKLFAERVNVIENYHQNWFKSLKDIQRTKKEIKDSKEDIDNLFATHLKFKEQCLENIKEKVKEEIKNQTAGIKKEIQLACEEITAKVLKIYEKCAKNEDLLYTNEIIEQIQQVLIEKINNLGTIIKKNHQQNRSKSQVQEQRIKTIQKELQARLKREEFMEHRSLLITTADASNLVKKCENVLKKQLQQFTTQQAELNQVLCSQNVLVRWIWTSGRVKGGNLVAWDHQAVNTLPQNFTYSSEEQCFKVASGGIYRFQLGFYAKKKPTIQIIINGQTIISAVNSNSYVLHHSSGKLKDISANEVSGLTYYDFFTLQENSRIAIAYIGQIGHGFIGLQRI